MAEPKNRHSKTVLDSADLFCFKGLRSSLLTHFPERAQNSPYNKNVHEHR